VLHPLFSATEQKKLYYSQDTDETRWEKHQCLLDLEPTIGRTN
jgi:hypothetical protein